MDCEEYLKQYPLPKAYFKMALPLVLSFTITIIYGLVDMYFVSMTGNVNLIAGVSIVSPIYTLILSFGDITGYGGGTFVAQFLGKKDHEKARTVCSFSFWISLVIGVILSIVLLLGSRYFISLSGADSEVVQYALDYYFWIALSAPSVILYCVFLNIARSEGRAKGAMIAILAGTVVNLILDPIFIFYLDMGAAGASLSTFIGMTVETLGCMFAALNKNKILSIKIKYAGIERKLAGRIFSVGFSASLINAMQTVMLVITNLMLVRYSAVAVSAMGVAQKIETIAYLLILGFAIGGQSLMSYAYGAGDKNKVMQIFTFSMKVCIVVAVLLSVAILSFAPRFMSLFTDNSNLISKGSQMLRIHYSSALFQAFVLVVSALGTSIGDSFVPLILSISRQGVVFVVVIVILSAVFGYAGVLAAQPVADIITAMFTFVLLNGRIKSKLNPEREYA